MLSAALPLRTLPCRSTHCILHTLLISSNLAIVLTENKPQTERELVYVQLPQTECITSPASLESAPLEQQRNVTLKDVADLAGVSVSTASRVLNGHVNVKRDMTLLVRNAVEELGYRPNIAARGLRLARSLTLGAVFDRLDSPLTTKLLTGLEAGAREHDYALLITNANGDPDVFRALIERLLERQVDGLLVYRPPNDLGECLRMSEAASVPVIGLFAKPRGVRVPLVTNRPTEAIGRAVDDLAALGHKSICYLATESESGDFRSQLLEESAGRNGVCFEILHLAEREDTDTIRETAAVIRTLATMQGRPTALLASYRHFPGLLLALQTQAWRIPEDLSLVSFGDGMWLQAHDPPIAAINTDGFEIGRAAALTAIEAIGDAPIEQVQELTGVEWVSRESIGHPGRSGSRLRRILG